MADSVAPPSPSLDAPVVAGRYALEEAIGEGGMATVYRARDVASGALIALKRLRRTSADGAEVDKDRMARARALFEREYHLLTQLAHPRVVRVLDYQVDAEGPFYTMELLDGRDLHALVPVPWQKACALIRDVCSVVALLHSRRVIHRDLSPRNVRCTSDGEAKLLDLGATIPMGPVKQIVGTPPICAPEVVNLEPLDARTDLYSLGATLYHALTGRHAYPAPEFRYLRKLWSEPIAPPSALARDVPPELDALVLSMLSLDPAARPASAAEVFDRLSAIAGLAADEQLHVSNAYLCSPALVGRTGPLARVRRRLSRARDGRGSSTLVLGEPGVGRSRFFTACSLEAKLLGLTVLRADAVDGQHGDYGGMRALARQLFDDLPEASLEAARPHASVLAHALPELLERLPDLHLEVFHDLQDKRPRLQQALRAWLAAISAHKPLLIAIDDIDAIDEPSAALATLLAQELGPQRIALLATAPAAAAQASFGALKLLREASVPLALASLDADDTARLVSSLFGEAPEAPLLAQRMFAVAKGNPRDVMALAQHLVDRGAIRYAAGSWTLPARFEAGDLPPSIAQAHKARIVALGEDSKGLARALAFAPDLHASFDEAQVLSGHDDPARMLRSLDELITAGVLMSANECFSLAQRDFAALLKDGLGADAQALHLRLAAVFEARGDAFRVAEQLLLAGEHARGLDVLLEHVRVSQAITDASTEAYNRLMQSLPPSWTDTYLRAIEACRALGRPRAQVHALFARMSELTPAGVGDGGPARAVLAQLKHDAGIDLYAALDPALDPLARLKLSFERTHARYVATPEQERVLEATQALRPLARACIQAVGHVATQLDLGLWEELPSLKPFEPLSASLGVVDLLNQGIGKRITARFEAARLLYETVLERLARPDRAGLDETYQRYTLLGVACGLGMIEAPMGLPSALERAKSIEGNSLHRANAELIAMLYHLWQGDVLAAEKHKQRVEVLRLQHSAPQLFEGGHLLAEVTAYACSDDLPRVKQALEGIGRMAHLPAWAPIQRYARGEYHRIRGDHAAALRELEAALTLAGAGRHQLWPEMASAHVRVLIALGRSADACTHGERYLQEAAAAGVHFGQNTIRLALACAYAESGEHAHAQALADGVIAALEALGSRGLNVGLAYEARARVALRANDRAGFSLWAERCAAIYRAADNRALIGKHERLLREARDPDARVQSDPSALLAPQMQATHLSAALLACPGPRERARLGLEVMVARSGAAGGFLYAIEPTGPTLVAQTGLDEAPTSLSQAVAEHLRIDAEDADITASDDATDVARARDASSTALTTAPSFVAFEKLVGAGRELRPCVIGHASAQRFEITGLAVLVVDPSKPFVPPAAVAAHLSRSWFESGEVSSISAWLSALAG